MNKERWGIYPCDETPCVWWGARTILRNKDIDILYDRQSYEGSEDVDFLSWINNVALNKIRNELKENRTKGEFTSECDSYHCEFDDRQSGGYLYIGCWSLENGT